jgi:hypothetical protein
MLTKEETERGESWKWQAVGEEDMDIFDDEEEEIQIS